MRPSLCIARKCLKLLMANTALMLSLHSAYAVEPLRIGMIPDAGATQISVEEKAPLQHYLEKELGIPVKLIIPTSYSATVEGLGNGSLDVAYFGGLTFVKAHVRYGAVPLVQRDIDRQFHALFITKKGSKINSIADLKGKRFCFGDINSTSGHLFPYLAMKKAGIIPDTDLKSYRYTGSHAATAQAVAAGVCDAGSLDGTVYKTMIAEGKIPGSEMKVFYVTPAFADYVWAARKDLPRGLEQKFSEALLRLKPGRDDKILAILRGNHFVNASDPEYAQVETVAKELGLM
ncbi:MAG TPA: phosphate/phosphite/phosphonate ABC transporter substrate-binding protein [Burkholderiales bacterium]|nr:phosphate/phosphite/phosphonate ABC transporter substrate-binding protein [Burkholderiales bacterium]